MADEKKEKKKVEKKAKPVRLKVLDIKLRERIGGKLNDRGQMIGGSVKTFLPGTVFDHPDAERAEALLATYGSKHIIKTAEPTSAEAAAKASKEAGEKAASENAKAAADQQRDLTIANQQKMIDDQAAAAEKSYEEAVLAIEGADLAELKIMAKFAKIDKKAINAVKKEEDKGKLVEAVRAAKAAELGVKVD